MQKHDLPLGDASGPAFSGQSQARQHMLLLKWARWMSWHMNLPEKNTEYQRLVWQESFKNDRKGWITCRFVSGPNISITLARMMQCTRRLLVARVVDSILFNAVAVWRPTLHTIYIAQMRSIYRMTNLRACCGFRTVPYAAAGTIPIDILVIYESHLR